MSSTRSPHLVPAGTPAPGPGPGRRPAGAPGGTPRRSSVARDRSLVAAVGAVTAVSLVGAALSVATGLSDTWWDAVGPTARLSVPLPMNLALVLLAALGAGTRRRPALVASALLALACSLAVVSGLFDGGYAADLAPRERAVQVALVLALTGASGLAARRLRVLVRASRR